MITGILTAEEFWAQHAVRSKDGGGGGGSKDGRKDGKTSQDVGVSGSFLSDIKPQVSIVAIAAYLKLVIASLFYNFVILSTFRRTVRTG